MSVLRVAVKSRHCAFVRGHGSRELLTELRAGRPPLWNATRRAWVTTESTAADLIAVAERRGMTVELVPPASDSRTGQLDPGCGRW